jgi:hypothetical protein
MPLAGADPLQIEIEVRESVLIIFFLNSCFKEESSLFIKPSLLATETGNVNRSMVGLLFVSKTMTGWVHLRVFASVHSLGGVLHPSFGHLTLSSPLQVHFVLAFNAAMTEVAE